MSEHNSPRSLRNDRNFWDMILCAAEKIGIVPKATHLAPELLTEIDRYLKYQDVASSLICCVEQYLQRNPFILAASVIEAPVKQDPHDILARAIKYFRYSLGETNKSNMVLAEAIVKRMALLQRSNQLKGLQVIMKLRNFCFDEYEAMVEENKLLIIKRDNMDFARRKLAQTKTSEEVEEKGKIYEDAVRQFDVQAEKINARCEELSRDKSEHQREFLDFFELQARYHKLNSILITEHLKKISYLKSP